MPIPLPVIANTFRCALRWSFAGSGQNAVNVIHIRSSAPGMTPAQAFTALDSSVAIAMWDSVVNVASVSEVDITPLDGATATASFSTGSPAKWSGSAGGDAEIAGAALVKLSTPTRGRSFRGRVFLPFTSEAATANGFLVAGLPGTMTTAWEGFRTALEALTSPWAIVVASYDRAHAGAGATATTVSSTLVEGALATQRRRQGRNR